MYTGAENKGDLQSIDHLTSDRSPLVVAAQTSDLLDKLAVMELHLAPAREYLHTYTLPYLESAVESSRILFEDEALRSGDFDPEGEMTARHVYVVMAWMHEMVTSPQLPMGFSRRGMLSAPTNKKEFSWRVGEMEEVLEIVSTVPNAIRTPDKNSGKIRTLNFFAVAGALRMHLPPTQRESAERERESLEKMGRWLAGVKMEP